MVAARLHTNEACYLDNAVAALHLRRSRIEISSWEVDDDDAPHSHGMMQISPAAADSSHYVKSPQADYYSPSSHHDNSPSLVVEGEAIGDYSVWEGDSHSEN